MIYKAKTVLILLLVLMSVAACQSHFKKGSPAIVESIPTEFKMCKDPRPQMCTKEYRPVCATVDTGIRCIKAPCPSTEKKTYANACTACSNGKVQGYMQGACK